MQMSKTPPPSPPTSKGEGPLPSWLVVLISIFMGLLIALLLSWFMYTLINTSKMALSEADRIHLLDFVRVKRSETAERKNRKPQRPVPQEIPDAPNQMDNSMAEGEQLTVNLSNPAGLDANMGLEGVGFASDSEYLPIVKVAPIYPRRAVARRLTGECLVRYTVTTAGTVKDVEVVENECIDPVFIDSSINAALRFKYKPRIVDGEAVEVHGVRNRFYFAFEDQPENEN